MNTNPNLQQVGMIVEIAVCQRRRSRSHRRPRRALAKRWTPATKRSIQHKIVFSKCRKNQQTGARRSTGAPPAQSSKKNLQ